MKFEQHIHELLKENDTVIIPGFGAFISKYKPAEIGENEIVPPSKEISFTKEIRNNDGLLVGYIAETEKISHFDALKLIEKERENIIFLLDKREEVKLERTGILSLNEKNEIQFVPEPDESLLLDSFGLEPVSLIDLNDTNTVEESEPIEIREPEKANGPTRDETSESNHRIDEDSEEHASPEEKPVTQPEQGSEEISGATEIKEQEEEVTSKESKDISDPEEHRAEEQPIEEVKPLIAEPEIEKKPVDEKLISEEVTSEPKNQEPIPVSEKEPVFNPKNESEEKKKRGGFWYLLILIPIIIAGVYILRNQKKDSNTPTTKEVMTPEQASPEVKQKEILSDSAQNVRIEEQVTDSANSVVPMDEKTELAVSDSYKFYLVGGGFKEEENAETYLNELKEKGLEPFHMGKRGNFYMIGIGKYKTEAEAVRAKREYTENHPGSGAWILEEE